MYIYIYQKLIFSKCTSKKCLTCPKASSTQVEDKPNLINFCKAFNVIYKISSNICNMSYITETSTPFHLRINQHRSD